MVSMDQIKTRKIRASDRKSASEILTEMHIPFRSNNGGRTQALAPEFLQAWDGYESAYKAIRSAADAIPDVEIF